MKCHSTTLCAGVLAALLATGPGRADAQTPAAGERSVPAVIELTPADLALLKSTVPGGSRISEDEVLRRLNAVKGTQGKPRVLLQRPGRAPAEISMKQLRDLLIERGRTELDTLRVQLRQGAAPLTPGRHEFKDARLTAVKESLLEITPARATGPLIVDFSLSPGLDLRMIKPAPLASAVVHWEPTPVGDVLGVALEDARSPFFIAETRLLSAGLLEKDLGPFTLRQRRDDMGEPAYSTSCVRVFFPDVAVMVHGDKRPIVVGHGQQRLVTHASGTYLVSILRSQHNEEVACGDSFEEAPWILEYTIRRIDDAAELARLRAPIEQEKDAESTPDDPVPGMRGDGPPDPKNSPDKPPRI